MFAFNSSVKSTFPPENQPMLFFKKFYIVFRIHLTEVKNFIFSQLLPLNFYYLLSVLQFLDKIQIKISDLN